MYDISINFSFKAVNTKFVLKLPSSRALTRKWEEKRKTNGIIFHVYDGCARARKKEIACENDTKTKWVRLHDTVWEAKKRIVFFLSSFSTLFTLFSMTNMLQNMTLKMTTTTTAAARQRKNRKLRKLISSLNHIFSFMWTCNGNIWLGWLSFYWPNFI